MSSGTIRKHYTTFTGAAAEIVLNLPFEPRTLKFYGTGGVWGIKMVGYDGMSSASYLSSTAADEGVTVDGMEVTIASGADINIAGETVYVECED